MELVVYNQEGKKVGSQKVPSNIFGLKMNQALVHQVYTIKLANQRVNYAHTKTRADKRGGGRKPWRQKGTGRARHGSVRSPLWVGGGVTFGPRREQVFSKKINKKMNKKAIAIVLSSKAKENNITFVLVLIANRISVDPKMQRATINKFFNIGEGFFVYDKPYSLLEQFAKEENIKIVNLYPVFKKEFLENKKNIYLEGDGHLNDYGHELFAKEISKKLAEENII